VARVSIAELEMTNRTMHRWKLTERTLVDGCWQSEIRTSSAFASVYLIKSLLNPRFDWWWRYRRHRRRVQQVRQISCETYFLRIHTYMYMTTIFQRYRQTDGQTDGRMTDRQTSWLGNTASCGNKI